MVWTANRPRASVVTKGAVVEINGLSRRFGPVAALEHIDLSIDAGEFVAILGPSGCGKSTLLRLVGGLDQPSSGTIRIDGVDVTSLPANKRPTATVFQRGAVFPHLSVFDNVAYPLRVRREERAQSQKRVWELLELVRLTDFADRAPGKLSGGQLQRVALARALAAGPAVLLMDEPLSALDVELKRNLELELRKIHRSVGVTVIYVTHDQHEAMTLAGRIAVMDRGRIEQCGPAATLLAQPRTEFVASFFGHAQIVTVEARGCGRPGPSRRVGGRTVPPPRRSHIEDIRLVEGGATPRCDPGRPPANSGRRGSRNHRRHSSG